MDYKKHYPESIECDFCGRSTYGAIYKNEPNIVKCTSCHMVLTDVESSVAKDGEWKKPTKSSHHTTFYKKQQNLFK